MAVSGLSALAVVAFIAIAAIQLVNSASRPCNLREYADGFVCVCNATYCDAFDENVIPYSKNEAVVVSSSQAGLRFNVQSAFFSKGNVPRTIINDPITTNSSNNGLKATISVSREKKYQKIVGFGGSHTGTVTYLLQQLPQSLQDFVYESYYSAKKGIAFTMTRIPIGGCDFDLSPWAYNEQPEHDAALSNFTKLDQRDLDRIVQIKRLKQVTGQKDIKFVGTAWSSPKWMKSNNAWTGYSDLLPQYYDAWANYHVQYLDLLRKQNIDYWAITTGNEPLNGLIVALLVPFMSLGWNPYDQAKWIANSLGPALRNSNVKDVKILAGDDQRTTFPWWFQSLRASDEKSIDYVDGFAVHYYLDRLVTPTKLTRTQEIFPDKLIINTESSIASLPGTPSGPALGSWPRAARYVDSYLEDLNTWVNGWIDWNLVLDEEGGPNYVSNFVDSPVITNASATEFYKQPLYHAIGHFSRFIPEHSIRVDVNTSDSNVGTVGFLRPDGRVALVIHNRSDLRSEIKIVDAKRSAVLVVPPKSVHTVVY